MFDRRRFLTATAASLASASSRPDGALWAQGIDGQDSLAGDGNSESGSSNDDAQYRATPLPDPSVETWRFGMILTTPVRCENVHATFTVPIDWPEQSIEPIDQRVDSRVRYEFRELPAGVAKQVVIEIPVVAAGSTVHATADIQITKSNLAAPESTDGLTVPAKLDRSLRMFTGTSPNIDSSNGLIKRAARELLENAPEEGWRRVETIYDFVREKVQYVEGPIRNASDALKTGQGDCEDMTSLFVALCRNARIPARMVWIPGHCYPEFYLEAPNGKGHWYPCQAAGTRQFGQMQETRPIIQKGDRFKVPESSSQVRYLTETFRCDRKGKGTPRPKFLRELVVS